MKKHRNIPFRFVEKMIQFLLLLILISLMLTIMWTVKESQRISRVVNYTDIVRGSTQRLVNQEITGTARQDLVNYLNYILVGLQYGDTQYQLMKLEDEYFQENLSNQVEYWFELKEEILHVRAYGYENTNIAEKNEKYYQLSYKTVRAAEAYAEKYNTYIRNIELMSAVCIIAFIAILFKYSIVEIRMAKTNKSLNKKAYIDAYTDLPNRSQCEEVMCAHQVINTPLCCIMFDLNNLKLVNDSYGHISGDAMILNFAKILKSVIPENEFVGRYGGDEFMAVISNTDERYVISLLNAINKKIEQFNQENLYPPLSYACGYAYSSDYDRCSLRVLLEEADHNMYLNKRKMKQEDNINT